MTLGWKQRVEAAYSEPHRHYHTLAHIEHMFQEAARFQPLAPPVEWAIWFHDFVYDPRSATNEEDSAHVARLALSEMGESEAITERTAELILATKHGSPVSQDGGDARLLVSLDLAILAAEPARYAEYVAQVRAEYAHVPEEKFRAGRTAFMRRFLEQDVIFPYPGFEGHEARARANIEREISGASPEFA
jgi:predicted metal-dependent HD superfamily phosphohydrolase